MISTARQREMIRQLTELVQYRAAREVEIDETFASQSAQCRSQADEAVKTLKAEFKQQYDALNSKYMGKLETARRHYESVADRVHKERDQRLEDIDSQYAAAAEAVEMECRQSQSLAERNYEQDIQVADSVAQQARETIADEFKQFAFLKSEATKLLRKRGRSNPIPDGRDINPDATTEVLLKRYRDAVRASTDTLARIRNNFAVRFVDEGWPVLLFIALVFCLGVPLGLWAAWSGWTWIAMALAGALVASAISRVVMKSIGNRQAETASNELENHLGRAAVSLQHAQDMVDIERRGRHEQLAERRDEAIEDAKQKLLRDNQNLDNQRAAEQRAMDQELTQQEKVSRLTWDKEAKEYRDTFPPQMEQLQTDHESEVQRMEFERDSRLAELAQQHAADWAALVERWRTGIDGFANEMQEMRSFCESRFPAFVDTDWDAWQAPVDVPQALPFGAYQVQLAELPGGLPSDDQLTITEQTFQIPAVLTFPEAPSLLIEAAGEGRDHAVAVFQRVMLNMLTALPAGKVRFTIIDPTGLGQNFSAFMHLADFDERLVNSRIWTENNHINQRLTDLTEHMENVIQKYLRNEFASIQEYNDNAGEVAEPFQVLVVANFPANFSDEATRRLVSIATSGARCGVFTLISADTKMNFPRNFDLADLESQANTLLWDEQRQAFAWKDPALDSFPLEVCGPVDDDLVTQVIRAAGRLAADANRVEVPFATVAPPDDEWWSEDSRFEFQVPLGRAGATKLQYMALGKGTSQHVLVAGKTGSGKSTLMHAMITNLALHYSPHELQFYLVDFKKGVEFKTYAQHQLPHAQVVAIESEREFGPQRTAAIGPGAGQPRGSFSQSRCSDIGAYRDMNPDDVMPRLFLIVDEFQEFFVSDDRIANESSLLLDRLVRQGRAFGIHVLLGSQTLAGAYSLARSTLGQMAVRIALQCSEADAHLILSEDNTAARLLSRPGEAIYNNANGLFEGNNPFQVVWLPDEVREDYLKRLVDLADQRSLDLPHPIIFEGNAAARLHENALLKEALNGTAHKTTAAWLGAAVAIKDPTSIKLRRQAGNHLLVVGQNEELADGILSASVVGISATGKTAAKTPPRFVVLDGGRFDSDEMNFGARLSRSLNGSVEAPAANQVGATINALYDEVESRMAADALDGPQAFLVIYNLARFRQLRRSEDDFGMSFGSDDDGPPKPDKMLSHILKEGPTVGVHVLLWCDSYNNLNRWFDRQALRDFAFRVLFQMSPTDSSNLMDSTAATHLGQFRAMLYDDERGEYEKFQPYGPPDNEFLANVAERL